MSNLKNVVCFFFFLVCDFGNGDEEFKHYTHGMSWIYLRR